jgi:predicted DNA binding CopG/RHH family protein
MKGNTAKEEQEILDSFEAGEWESVRNPAGEKKQYENYARETLRKNRRVNIRISEYDLKAIQLKAMEEGMPYQTFISSVLHKVADGRISHHS